MTIILFQSKLFLTLIVVFQSRLNEENLRKQEESTAKQEQMRKCK